MKQLLKFVLLFISAGIFAQAGHIMQGVGAVNMSMGGAATAQPLDISGAIQWNPAALSTFNNKIINFDIGAFFSAPELSSVYGSLKGETLDDRGVSPMPALAMVWGKEGSKHTFGASAFGISGFGVTFPENMNYPQDLMGNPNSNFNPSSPLNPINFPQYAGGFGHVESDYMLLQIGLTWAYEVTDNFSIGIQPNFDYATLKLEPNPLASPGAEGWPKSNKATAIGYGAQFGLFYESDGGVKLGASYKTTQKFTEFEFSNEYISSGSAAPDVNFQMDYPAILSFGLGYSVKDFDIAVDYRWVDYENTEGFEASGWTQTASVAGFGWRDVNIFSAGIQYKGIDKLPLRVGYTYSSNPISEELAFFSIPATAVIKNAFQFGFGYEINDNFTLNGVYHHGASDGKTEGPMLSPMAIGAGNPLGAVPGTKVGYEMTTDMVMLGISYTFSK